MSYIFIVNPLSKTVSQKGSALKSILKMSNNAPVLNGTKLFETDFSSTQDQFIDQAIHESIEHIFIEGGDGTAQGILTQFLRRKSEFKHFPKFTLLRGGMTNQVAKTIGLQNCKPTTLLNALNAKNMKTSKVPMLKITSAQTSDSYGFLFSTGAVPMITDYTKREVHKKGVGGSTAVAAGIIKGISGRADNVMHRTPIELNIIGPTTHTLSEEHLGTLVTTLPRLIMGLDPFWGVEAAPLRLTIAGQATRKLAQNVASLWLGQKNISREKDGLKSYNAHTLEYRYAGPIVLDGEPLDFNGQAFEISATEPIEFIH